MNLAGQEQEKPRALELFPGLLYILISLNNTNLTNACSSEQQAGINPPPSPEKALSQQYAKGKNMTPSIYSPPSTAPNGYPVSLAPHPGCIYGSCHVVLGALSALGDLPVDILVGSLDVACLAVDAAISAIRLVSCCSSIHLFLDQDSQATSISQSGKREGGIN